MEKEVFLPGQASGEASLEPGQTSGETIGTHSAMARHAEHTIDDKKNYTSSTIVAYSIAVKHNKGKYMGDRRRNSTTLDHTLESLGICYCNLRSLEIFLFEYIGVILFTEERGRNQNGHELTGPGLTEESA